MPGLVTGSFGGTLTPAQVWALLNALIEGAPFSASLTRAETATGVMAFPTVAPTGFAWLEQLQEVPELTAGDKALIVAVAKIAGLLPISSEMQSDAAVNITTWVQGALGDSLSRDLDLGILGGSGAPAPTGVLGQADEVTGTTLTEATGKAIAEIGEAGGSSNTIAVFPTVYVEELTREDDAGRPVHPDRWCPGVRRSRWLVRPAPEGAVPLVGAAASGLAADPRRAARRVPAVRRVRGARDRGPPRPGPRWRSRAGQPAVAVPRLPRGDHAPGGRVAVGAIMARHIAVTQRSTGQRRSPERV